MPNGGGQGDRAEALVGVQQHRAGQAGDVGRQEEVDEWHDAAAEETRAAFVERALDELQPDFHRVGGRQADERLEPGLLEAEPGVAQDVEHRDRGGETAQAAEAVGAVPLFGDGVAGGGAVWALSQCMMGSYGRD